MTDFDPDSNLVLRWLRSLNDRQRDELANRYQRMMASRTNPSLARIVEVDPARALGSLLVTDCAASLGLSVSELTSLLASPRRHVMRSVAWLALDQIRSMRTAPSARDVSQFAKGDPLDGVTQLHHRDFDLPERIARRMNDLSL
jgi:hypothetical protein